MSKKSNNALCDLIHVFTKGLASVEKLSPGQSLTLTKLTKELCKNHAYLQKSSTNLAIRSLLSVLINNSGTHKVIKRAGIQPVDYKKKQYVPIWERHLRTALGNINDSKIDAKFIDKLVSSVALDKRLKASAEKRRTKK